MDIITTMTTYAASLRACLRPSAQAFLLDLSGETSAQTVIGSGLHAAGINGSEARHIFREVGVPFSAERRPHTPRFFLLSCTAQVV